MHYRMTIDNTYTSTANATTVLSAINTALTNSGRSEQASRTGSAVTVVIEPIADQAAAESLRAALLPAWTATARNFGVVSIVRVDP